MPPTPALPEVVTYDGLPAASGGAHGLRARRPEAALAQVRAFLDACTVADRDPVWSLVVSADGDGSADLAETARAALGGPRERTRTGSTWGVAADAVPRALDLVAAAGPDARTRYGHPLATLTCTVPVRLLDPATGAPSAGVTSEDCGGFAVDGYGRLLGASGVRATVGTSASSLSLWLNLPADDRLVPGARHVQEHLPFRLSAKHWRRWVPTRTGGYRSVRLASPLAAG